jgi:FKBP-type peptidyl-prolyl cis-trans isomerase FklB
MSTYIYCTTISWTEAMQLMKEGGKWELYLRSELGYGDRGAGALIPGGAVLIFELELLEVQGNYVQ